MTTMRFIEGLSETCTGGADFTSLIKTIQFLNKNTLPHFRTPKDYSADMASFTSRLVAGKSQLLSFMAEDLGYSLELGEYEFSLLENYLQTYPYSPLYQPQSTIPEGLIAVHGTWSSPVYRFLDQVMPCLLQEGSVLLYCEPEASRIYCHLSELLAGTALAQNRIAVLPIADPDVLEILLDHPSIHGVQGQMHLYQSGMYRARPLSPEKIYNLHFGAHNPVLFMNDGDLSLIPALLEQTLPFHIRSEVRFNRWFVQEKIFPDVLRTIQAHLETPKNYGNILVKSYQAAFEDQKKELRSSRHWLFPQDSFANICTDFSNCSPLHQTELVGPLLTITRFKNGPEATKFAGTTHYANMTAIITASKEKYLDLAALQRTPFVEHNALPLPFDVRLKSGIKHCSLRTSDSVASQTRELGQRS